MTRRNGQNRQPRDQYRFGIGEWYGRSFIHLSPAERRAYATLTPAQQKQQPCLPRRAENPEQRCTKKGGVCSLRKYHLSGQAVSVITGADGDLRTTCPYRFLEGLRVFQWVGETILGDPKPLLVKEVGFLEKQREQEERKDDVGRIDTILVHREMERLSWCALEMQAVYFSGEKMSHDFEAIANHEEYSLPFPVVNRRPDYRSSGPKRLMPQLQIKVPTLRRWGKKMAVVVDESFIAAMGEMGRVGDMSNSDIAWFVVRYNEGGGQATMKLGEVHYTTLERAVEGLTAGTPVSLAEFENRIRQKLNR